MQTSTSCDGSSLIESLALYVPPSTPGNCPFSDSENTCARRVTVPSILVSFRWIPPRSP